MDEIAVLCIAVGACAALLLFQLAAWRWGVDSTDGPASPEWERRRRWRGLGGPDGGMA